MKKTIDVCDVCGGEKPLKTFRLGRQTGPTRTLELCEEDAAPLTKLLDRPQQRVRRQRSLAAVQ